MRLLLVLALIGCAAKKPVTVGAPRLVIPADCVLDTHFSTKTVCRDKGDGNHAVCSNMIVHYNCVKVSK